MLQTYISVLELNKISVVSDKLILWGWSNLGLISDDSRGQLFSLDLLFALIPIVLVLGMVASDMDNITYLIQDTVYRSSTERVAADTVDTLLKTSGTPSDWESTGNPQVVGLVKFDPVSNKSTPDVISAAKLGAIKGHESYINGSQGLMGPQYGFNITITYLNGPKKGVSIYPLGTTPNGTDIVKIERVVLYGELDIVSELKDSIRYTKSPRDYMSTKPFPTNVAYLDAYDYYVLVDNTGITSARINFNHNKDDAVTPNDFKNNENPIVRKINSTMLMNQTGLQYNYWEADQVASKPGSKMDIYIIRVDKDTSPSEVNMDNVRQSQSSCLFQFYAWTK